MTVCLYTGPADQCSECGGFNNTGQPFCSYECAASRADRDRAAIAADVARRARENAFAAECDRLSALGLSDEEIDVALAGMPT